MNIAFHNTYIHKYHNEKTLSCLPYLGDRSIKALAARTCTYYFIFLVYYICHVQVPVIYQRPVCLG